MQVAVFLIFLSASYPLWRAWRNSRRTPLASAVVWATVAWAGWTALAQTAGDASRPEQAPLRYLALALTCCAGVAVLGARRPGAGAWNAVVVGLLGILLLPLAEQLLVGADSFGLVRTVFLIATLAFIFFNYLPTCFAPATFLFVVVGSIETALVRQPDSSSIPEMPNLIVLALIPWLALLLWHTRPKPPSEFDWLWRDFRNRWGFVWAARLREQFNRAAANADWPVHLYWQGLHIRQGETLPDPARQEEILRALQALLKRFS